MNVAVRMLLGRVFQATAWTGVVERGFTTLGVGARSTKSAVRRSPNLLTAQFAQFTLITWFVYRVILQVASCLVSKKVPASSARF